MSGSFPAVFIGEDNDYRVYGWRAIAIGCVALVIGDFAFTSAFGFVYFDDD